MIKAIAPPPAGSKGVPQGMIIDSTKLFISGGHVGVDASGEPITSSIEDQIVGMFENLENTLSEAGLNFSHVVRATCFVREFTPDILEVIKVVRARYFNENALPASVVVQAGLYDPRLYAEMEVIAESP